MNGTSKSITEISKETDIDRTVIPKYLKTLHDSGLVIEEQEGTSKFYTIIPNFRDDTYFGLPLDKERKENAYSLYFLIRKYWKEFTSNKLSNTHAKKIAYKVIKQHSELNIPYGWYIYGGVDILAYDDSRSYQNYRLPDGVENTVKKVSEEYSKVCYAWEAKKLQYEQENNPLYNIKEELLALLYSSNFDSHPKNSLHIFLKKLKTMINLSPKVDNVNYNEIIDSYQDLMLDITNKLDDEIIRNHKRQITLLSEAFWEYVALFNFKNDLKDFYSPKILTIHFKMDIAQQEEKVINLGSELQSLIPDDELEPSKKEFNDKLYQNKPICQDQLKEQKDSLDDLKKEMGEEKFNNFLREKFGL